MSLESFLAVDFRWTRQLPSIWNDGTSPGQSLNVEVLHEILDDFGRSTTDDPMLGHVVVGTAGSGKTHLMATIRREVIKSGDWFVLLDFAGITDFWRSTALGFLNSLHQPLSDGKPQFRKCLESMASKDKFPEFENLFRRVKQRLDEGFSPANEDRTELVRLFLIGVERKYGQAQAMSHQAVVRAYLQLLLGDTDTRNSAYAWLQGMDLEQSVLSAAGLPGTISSRDLVAGTVWMLSCVGCVLVCVDQIDAIVTEQNLAPQRSTAVDESRGLVQSIVQSMAGGLMELYDLRGRAMTVLSCLEGTWSILGTRVTVAVTDRFNAPRVLHPIRSASAAREIVISRLAKAYAARGFDPPYEAWPFAPGIFETAVHMAPRSLLKACEAHRLRCRAQGRVTELTSFVETVAPPLPVEDHRHDIDQKFAAFKHSAEIEKLGDPAREDDLKALLFDVLGVYAEHIVAGDDVDVGVTDDKQLSRPSLHARMVFAFRALGERERHFCFRVLPQTNAVAFQARLRAAMTASGLDRALPFRHLVIVRSSNPPQGPKTAALVDEFRTAGGLMIAPSQNDLRAMRALVALRNEPGLADWLRNAQPFAQIELFSRVGLHKPVGLDDAPDGAPAQGAAPPSSTAPVPPPPAGIDRAPLIVADLVQPPVRQQPPRDGVGDQKAITDPKVIPVGRRIEGGTQGRETTIPLMILPRHVAILAGAGAGKTVLVRRLIEEAVLRGVPALVLDSNNDLSTLGDAWPEPPAQWTSADAASAQAYHQAAEVVIWTPGLQRGRPITLDVLPDFDALGGADTDEQEQAIDMATSTVASLVRLTPLKRGVLADVLRAFAQTGRRGLDPFVDLLADLPLDASKIDKAQKIGLEIANQLRAAMSTNPLLRGGGPALDARAFFTSPVPGKTRVSVISFVGLPSDESKQEFVNRLQMALFTWIKREPSATPRLYVVDEARNFMPSQAPAASKESAIALAAQARKYGLGLIVATQAPRDIDNRVISNCTTQFYGKMNSPAAIATIGELIANKGGSASDVGALPSGTFYFSTEGSAKPVKVQTAMCLSYHPLNPPGSDEVIRRAATRD